LDSALVESLEYILVAMLDKHSDIEKAEQSVKLTDKMTVVVMVYSMVVLLDDLSVELKVAETAEKTVANLVEMLD
jgi:hypothetical protein